MGSNRSRRNISIFPLSLEFTIVLEPASAYIIIIVMASVGLPRQVPPVQKHIEMPRTFAHPIASSMCHPEMMLSQFTGPGLSRQVGVEE